MRKDDMRTPVVVDKDNGNSVNTCTLETLCILKIVFWIVSFQLLLLLIRTICIHSVLIGEPYWRRYAFIRGISLSREGYLLV